MCSEHVCPSNPNVSCRTNMSFKTNSSSSTNISFKHFRPSEQMCPRQMCLRGETCSAEQVCPTKQISPPHQIFSSIQMDPQKQTCSLKQMTPPKQVSAVMCLIGMFSCERGFFYSCHCSFDEINLVQGATMSSSLTCSAGALPPGILPTSTVSIYTFSQSASAFCPFSQHQLRCSPVQ